MIDTIVTQIDEVLAELDEQLEVENARHQAEVDTLDAQRSAIRKARAELVGNAEPTKVEPKRAATPRKTPTPRAARQPVGGNRAATAALRAEKIGDLLRNGPMGTEAIGKGAGIPKGSIVATLRRLVAAGTIQRNADGSYQLPGHSTPPPSTAPQLTGTPPAHLIEAPPSAIDLNELGPITRTPVNEDAARSAVGW